MGKTIFAEGGGREWKDKEEGGGRSGSRGDGARWGDGRGSYRLALTIRFH